VGAVNWLNAQFVTRWLEINSLETAKSEFIKALSVELELYGDEFCWNGPTSDGDVTDVQEVAKVLYEYECKEKK
jgi:hypothetical protein